jgi:hypothetical protein
MEGEVMKTTRLNSILQSSIITCALVLGSLAISQNAAAQESNGLADVNIPFAFQTANMALPAGHYRIDKTGTHLILLRGPDNKAEFVAMYNTSTTHASATGKLVFDRVGGNYYLREIWTANSTEGLECPKSRAEKASIVAKADLVPSTTEVAFNTVPAR